MQLHFKRVSLAALGVLLLLATLNYWGDENRSDLNQSNPTESEVSHSNNLFSVIR